MSDWLPSRDPKGPMHEAHAVLAKQSIQGADEGSLPASKKRFADGSRWKIEIPSVEGPQAFKVVLEEAAKLKVPVSRISQGSGIMMQLDSEIQEMVKIGNEKNIEVCLFIGPRASWDIGKQSSSSAGIVTSPTLRGADQLRYALEDVIHGAKLGVRSVLVGDIGLLKVLGQAKKSGDLPADFILKTSVAMPCNNPATAQVLQELGASTLNLATDLSLEQISAIRSQVDIPVDVYVEGPDDFGGAVRHYEVPDLVRIAAPIYIKFTLRNSPGLYPAGGHIQGLVESTARERVRRAAIGVSMLTRYGLN
jgi:Peptidase family U32